MMTVFVYKPLDFPRSTNLDKYNQNKEFSIYLIQCNISKCNQRYIGETKNSIKDRMSDHIGYARTKKLDQATGSHFNKPGHSVANMQITILEKMRTNETEYRKQREKILIRLFNT